MPYGFYVYYRVTAETVPALRARLQQMHAALAASTGVAARLMSKAEEPLLWMEVYENVADRAVFTRQLDEALAAHEIASLLPLASRKTEIFKEALQKSKKRVSLRASQ